MRQTKVEIAQENKALKALLTKAGTLALREYDDFCDEGKKVVDEICKVCNIKNELDYRLDLRLDLTLDVKIADDIYEYGAKNLNFVLMHKGRAIDIELNDITLEEI